MANFLNMKVKFFYLRFFMLLLGCILIAYGVSVFKYVNLGTDPYASMIIGIGKIFDTSYGTVLFIMNIILFILSVIIDKTCIKKIGIGSIVNIGIIGIIIDYLTSIYPNFIINPMPFYLKMLWSLSAFLIFCIGVSLYIKSDLGIAPYELVSMAIISKSKNRFDFKQVRVVQDILALISGFLLGSTIGINTIILSFFTGLVTHFTNSITSKYLVKERW